MASRTVPAAVTAALSTLALTIGGHEWQYRRDVSALNHAQVAITRAASVLEHRYGNSAAAAGGVAAMEEVLKQQPWWSMGTGAVPNLDGNRTWARCRSLLSAPWRAAFSKMHNGVTLSEAGEAFRRGAAVTRALHQLLHAEHDVMAGTGMLEDPLEELARVLRQAAPSTASTSNASFRHAEDDIVEILQQSREAQETALGACGLHVSRVLAHAADRAMDRHIYCAIPSSSLAAASQVANAQSAMRLTRLAMRVLLEDAAAAERRGLTWEALWQHVQQWRWVLEADTLSEQARVQALEALAQPVGWAWPLPWHAWWRRGPLPPSLPADAVVTAWRDDVSLLLWQWTRLTRARIVLAACSTMEDVAQDLVLGAHMQALESELHLLRRVAAIDKACFSAGLQLSKAAAAAWHQRQAVYHNLRHVSTPRALAGSAHLCALAAGATERIVPPLSDGLRALAAEACTPLVLAEERAAAGRGYGRELGLASSSQALTTQHVVRHALAMVAFLQGDYAQAQRYAVLQHIAYPWSAMANWVEAATAASLHAMTAVIACSQDAGTGRRHPPPPKRLAQGLAHALREAPSALFAGHKALLPVLEQQEGMKGAGSAATKQRVCNTWLPLMRLRPVSTEGAARHAAATLSADTLQQLDAVVGALARWQEGTTLRA